jgi:hypothetical protein
MTRPGNMGILPMWWCAVVGLATMVSAVVADYGGMTGLEFTEENPWGVQVTEVHAVFSETISLS